jgi:hypothetical protein
VQEQKRPWYGLLVLFRGSWGKAVGHHRLLRTQVLRGRILVQNLDRQGFVILFWEGVVVDLGRLSRIQVPSQIVVVTEVLQQPLLPVPLLQEQGQEQK